MPFFQTLDKSVSETRNLKPEIRTGGFTLIELMVVISIIGIVFGVIITSIFQIKKNSRDAQRQSDVAKIQAALQSYYTDQTYYPATLGTSITSGSATYLSTVPTDPLNQSSYCYIPYTDPSASNSNCTNTDPVPTNRCNYYKLYANMENSGNISNTIVCGSTFNNVVSPP